MATQTHLGSEQGGRPVDRNTGRQARVTVGVPIYNEAKYLAQALVSLLAQDFRDLEIVIFDNGSTDGSTEICRQLAASDARIRYYRSPVNRGAIASFRKTLNLGSGEYFMWAAGHDLWAPQYVSRCAALLDSDADVVLVYSRVGLIDNDGRVVEVVAERLDTRGLPPFERFRATLGGLQRTAVNDMIYGLIRASCLKSVPFRNGFAPDMTVSAALSLYGSFAQLDECLYFRRKYSGRSEMRVVWTDEYMARVDPRNRYRRFQLTYLDLYWAYCGLIVHSPYSLFQKVHLLIYACRPVCGRHFRPILFHDVVCGTLRVFLGNEVAAKFKRWVSRFF